MIDLVARQAPAWSPEFVDRAVATRVYAELARVSAEVRAQPSTRSGRRSTGCWPASPTT